MKYDSRVARLDEWGSRIIQHRDEARKAFALMQAIRPCMRFLEIGSRKGGSLYVYAGACEPGAKIVAVDPSIERRPRIVLRRVVQALEAEGYDMTWIRAESQELGALQGVQGAFGNESIDVLHIDGDHSYDAVSRDYQIYSPLVRTGGVIILHDIDNPNYEVARFWKELQARGEAGREWKSGKASGMTGRAGIGVVIK